MSASENSAKTEPESFEVKHLDDEPLTIIEDNMKDEDTSKQSYYIKKEATTTGNRSMLTKGIAAGTGLLAFHFLFPQGPAYATDLSVISDVYYNMPAVVGRTSEIVIGTPTLFFGLQRWYIDNCKQFWI